MIIEIKWIKSRNRLSNLLFLYHRNIFHFIFSTLMKQINWVSIKYCMILRILEKKTSTSLLRVRAIIPSWPEQLKVGVPRTEAGSTGGTVNWQLAFQASHLGTSESWQDIISDGSHEDVQKVQIHQNPKGSELAMASPWSYRVHEKQRVMRPIILSIWDLGSVTHDLLQVPCLRKSQGSSHLPLNTKSSV